MCSPDPPPFLAAIRARLATAEADDTLPLNSLRQHLKYIVYVDLEGGGIQFFQSVWLTYNNQYCQYKHEGSPLLPILHALSHSPRHHTYSPPFLYPEWTLSSHRHLCNLLGLPLTGIHTLFLHRHHTRLGGRVSGW